MEHNEIVHEAAHKARAHMLLNMRAGIVEPLRLYYRKGELLLLNAADFDVNKGESNLWIDSGRDLPISLSLHFYCRWIHDNSRDLPIF